MVFGKLSKLLLVFGICSLTFNCNARQAYFRDVNIKDFIASQTQIKNSKEQTITNMTDPVTDNSHDIVNSNNNAITPETEITNEEEQGIPNILAPVKKEYNYILTKEQKMKYENELLNKRKEDSKMHMDNYNKAVQELKDTGIFDKLVEIVKDNQEKLFDNEQINLSDFFKKNQHIINDKIEMIAYYSSIDKLSVQELLFFEAIKKANLGFKHVIAIDEHGNFVNYLTSDDGNKKYTTTFHDYGILSLEPSTK